MFDDSISIGQAFYFQCFIFLLNISQKGMPPKWFFGREIYFYKNSSSCSGEKNFVFILVNILKTLVFLEIKILDKVKMRVNFRVWW